ncbi:hypothetical protein N7493_000347 [Penicillium malachiteum]|uniref:Hydrolase n=1 Tax=Penicillium malachiteum TaxID=1324776 RepID=A0AAD6HW56_9EURO|nr:hypothetical protein N7493_000347 [Penicillium malachiteum]
MMRLLRNTVFSLLVGTGLAYPGSDDRQAPVKHPRAAGYSPKEPPLTTPWTDKVGTDPWPEYPRPQLQRAQWQNLNGIWQYQNASSLAAVQNPPFGQDLAQEVLIPSCLESGLSGIQGSYMLYSWFSTSFEVPSDWNGQSILLNFGAVDYEATVFVNGKKAGFHRGGYFRFSLDVTRFLKAGQENEFGIWQSVWIEPVPTNHVSQLDIDGNMDGQLNMTVHTSAANTTSSALVVVKDGDNIVATHRGPTNRPFQFKVDSPSLWSPDSPKLYNITVKLGEDKVQSYTGFRTIAKGTVDGVVRPLLNGEFIFMFGTLDQGFWPDGIYTPPTKEAMVYDLEMLKRLGFNMVRKHIKVENDLFYRACDELGLLVIQDMPAMRPLQSKALPNCGSETLLPDEAQQAEFTRQLEVLINQHKSFPSIATWIIYNEGWGQITSYYPEFELTDLVRQLDPTRLIDSTTGWYDHGAGDFSDNHHYSDPQCGTPFYSTASSPYDDTRIGFQGEFGGIGNNVSIEHLWNDQAAINTINQTYELDLSLEAWNYRSHVLLSELQNQIRLYSCSGGVWTQTTDVEGEVNGLMTYDRRLSRVDEDQWKSDIQSLYDAAAARTNKTMAAS